MASLAPAALAATLLLTACGSRPAAPVKPDVPAETPRGVLVLVRRDLRRINFERSELYRAEFTQSDLTQASFSMSFLGSADLRSVRAIDTNFRQADLSRADLQSAKLMGADFRGADLFEANLYDADLRGASLDGANLSRARLERAHLGDTVFKDARGLTRAQARAAACWNERTVWPEAWAGEGAGMQAEPVRPCHLHR